MHVSFDDFAAISQRLNDASLKLASMTKSVAAARQVREFESDRRKRALALAVRDVLNAAPDTSAAAAEMKGRASDGYGAAMKALAKDLRAAEQVIADWDACKTEWESARSLLSVHKAITANI